MSKIDDEFGPNAERDGKAFLALVGILIVGIVALILTHIYGPISL